MIARHTFVAKLMRSSPVLSNPIQSSQIDFIIMLLISQHALRGFSSKEKEKDKKVDNLVPIDIAPCHTIPYHATYIVSDIRYKGQWLSQSDFLGCRGLANGSYAKPSTHSGCWSTEGLFRATHPRSTSGISASSLLSIQKPMFTVIRSKLWTVTHTHDAFERRRGVDIKWVGWGMCEGKTRYGEKSKDKCYQESFKKTKIG